MAKKFQPVKRPGEFTRKAKAAGMSLSAFAYKVLAENSKASTLTKRQAAFYRAQKKWKH